MKRFLLIPILGLAFFGCEKVADIKPSDNGLFVRYYGNQDRTGSLEAGSMVVSESEIVVVGTILNDEDIENEVLPHQDIYLFKTDKIGKLQIEKKIDTDSLNADFGRDIKNAPDGGYYVLGQRDKANGGKDIVVMKVSSSLETEWIDIPEALGENEEPRALLVQEDGGLAILGDYTDNLGDIWSFIYIHYHDDPSESRHFDPYGASASDTKAGKALLHHASSGYSFACTPNNFSEGTRSVLKYVDERGVNAGGTFYGLSTEGVDLIKFGAQYVMLSNNLNSSGYSENISLFRIEESDENSSEEVKIEFGGALGGNAISSTDDGFLITGEIDNGNNTDICLIKTDANGLTVWDSGCKSFGGTGNDYGVDVAALDDGYIVLGIARVAGLKMITLIKTDLKGNLVTN